MTAARAARIPLLVLALLALGGCPARVGVPASLAIQGASDDDFPDAATLAVAASRNVEALERSPATSAGTDLLATAKAVQAIVVAASSPADLAAALAKRCRAIAAAAPAKVTAYYEPVLPARRTRDARFRYPLYAMPSPAQLEALRLKLGRMPTRADIDGGGVLDGLGLEIAWLDDPVDRFFLQVQGSGRLAFDDGSQRAFGYAGTNGAEYRSVGSVMLRRGLVQRGAAGGEELKAWLKAHPSERDAILFENPRYGFFRETAGGPRGAFGVELVAQRSVAVDPAETPLGGVLWLRTSWPVVEEGRVTRRRTSSRLVFAHDTGAAIRGPGRVDVYVGSGDGAGIEAGAVDERGELWLLRCR